MCEPAHSIVQIETEGVPFGKFWDRGCRILDWMHYSKLGAGHSGVFENGKITLYMPNPVYYEGLWWDRAFRIDGAIRYRYEEDSFAAAKEYHERVCMKDIKTFRKFLENSISETSRPVSYFDALLDHVLTRKTADAAHRRMRRIFGNTYVSQLKRKEAVNCVLGYTRKRANFRSHFSDDNGFWCTA